ncbi:MAG: aminotransferase V [Gemmatimonadetes bacterium]|nr:aminotransferase V [Gemmatimonadota bacterium]
MNGRGEVCDGICGICPAGCWVRVEMREGRMIEVAPNPDHPLGMICTIGRHSPRVVHDPDRLRTPLRRTGPKGSHRFAPISWDDAFAEIVERLETIKSEHGAEACGIYTGRGSFDMALCDLFQPAGVEVSSASSILFPFGSPNSLGVGALCYVSFAMIAPHTTMGEMFVTMDTDVDQAELIVVWGANPATDSPPSGHQRILRARERGAEVVVIDPRRNRTARESGAQWIPLRPGTDGALALGLIEVLIEEELIEEEFVENWTVGYEGLTTLAQHYRAEVVEGVTGVPAETVRSLARRIAGARGAAPVMYTGLEYSDSGVQAIRAVFTLWALAGQLDVPGGLLFRMKENRFPQNRRHLVPNPDMRKALGRDRFPVYSQYRGESHAIALPDSVLRGEPYRLRALLILGGSIITAWPNPSLWRETLGALDFLVTIDRYHTADSAYADIVLPATTGYEMTSYLRYGPLFKIRERLVTPEGDARSDFLILTELAQRLGFGDRYPQSEEELLKWALEGTGFTVEEVRERGGSVQIPTVMMEYRKWEKGRLRADGHPGFDTPSGKFEIASSLLEEHGYDPLPVYTEPAEGPLSRPDLAERYPLVFNSGARNRYDFRSQHHGVEGLRERLPEPTVIVNDLDAAAREIEDGDAVWVETARGRAHFRARVTPEIVRGAVDAGMGGGGPLGSKAWRKCNVNDLTDLEHFDPISGFPVYKTLLCEVGLVEAVRSEGKMWGTDTRKDETKAGLDAWHATAPNPPKRIVYLDNNATTSVDAEVLGAMLPLLREECGNPSSIHSIGSGARSKVEDARRKIAQVLNCTARRIVFTGSGTEANNLAIEGTIRALGRPAHIVTSAVEHPAVLNPCRALEAQGHALTVLPVDREGRVDPAELADAFRDDTALVSIMLANNETGTIEPIAECVALARERGILFHTDAVQALGKIPLDVRELGVDLLSVSSHKINGPKGVGALYRRKGVAIDPLVHGGGQESGLRSGTENVPGIVGFGKACEVALRRLNDGEMGRVGKLRDHLEAGIAELATKAIRNGSRCHCLPNTLNTTLPGVRGESLVLHLDRCGVAFSSGSACKSGNPDPSHALLAMGLSEEDAHCALRFSLGVGTSREDVDYTLESLGRVLRDTFAAVRFVGCR